MSQIENFTAWLDDNEKRTGLNDCHFVQRAGISHTVLVRARQGNLRKRDASYALASALDIPPQEVFIVAGLIESPPDYDPDVARVVHKIATLPANERAMLEVMLDGLMKARAGGSPALVR